MRLIDAAGRIEAPTRVVALWLRHEEVSATMVGIRRLLPWLATGLLTVGTTVGGIVGALGLPGQSPSAWANQLLATTRSAGTAQFEVTSVTTSPSPLFVHSQTQSGLVDFRSGSYALQINAGPGVSGSGFEELGVGRHQYVLTTLPGVIPPRTQPRSGLDPLGVSTAIGSLGALGSPGGVWEVRRLGTTRVAGVATTTYQVDGGACGSGTSAATSVKVWVDSRGRLVQLRVRTRAPVNLRGSISLARSLPTSWRSTSVTTTEELRFSHFGRPVQIPAPGSTGSPNVAIPAVQPLLPMPKAHGAGNRLASAGVHGGLFVSSHAARGCGP